MGLHFYTSSHRAQSRKTMKILLVIALFAAVHAEEEAAPAEAAPVGAVLYHHYPGFYHHAPVYAHHVAPAVYHAPVVYTAANVCKNEGGQLVPCAHGVAPGSAIYAHVGAPAAVVPAAAAPAEDEAVVSVEKRGAEAEADPAAWYYGYYGHGYYGHPYGYAGYYGYYGHPYYAGYGCRNNAGALVPCAGK